MFIAGLLELFGLIPVLNLKKSSWIAIPTLLWESNF